MADKRRLSRRRVIGLTLALVALVSAWWFAAYPRGAAAAWCDTARGRYAFLVHGLPHPWDEESSRLLGEKYGVKMRSLGGCVVSSETAAFLTGYNAVAGPRMREHFGKDVVAECEAEARAAWEADERLKDRP